MALISSWINGLTPEMSRVAEKELKETPEKRKEALKEIKRIIKGVTGFFPLKDDEFLLRFLRAKKFDVNEAFDTLKTYYKFKFEYSGILTDFLPSDFRNVFEMDKIFISPKRTPNGEGIFIVFAGSIDFRRCTFEDFLRAVLIAAEIGLEMEGTQVCGCRIVIDLRGMSLVKLRNYIKPTLGLAAAKYLQHILPCRVKGIHLIYEEFYFDAAFQTLKYLMKPFLRRKMRKRIYFQSDDLQSLHQQIPPRALPYSLGGCLGQKHFQDFRTIMLQNDAFMKRLNRYTFNGEHSKETLRDIEHDPKVTTKTLIDVLTS
ncbi:Clavesin-1 like protein [Argiope bruennichi]|uniref:Clavesin-1 like protein n=1 Tax=Argiope bruennichi TaxID=94029 RepID=A0A8T0EVP2_ARGBR|nr:Clavesin-1 like protein [Argiope bruennichi]